MHGNRLNKSGCLVSLMIGLLVIASLVRAADVSVTLSWLPNTEADLAGYKVYQSRVSGTFGTTPKVTLGPVTTYTFTLPQLDVDTTYYFALTAYDIAGNESGLTPQLSKVIAALPRAPSTPILTVVPGLTSVTVSWPPGSDGASGVPKIDVRIGAPTDHWGIMTSKVCPASPCVITGLVSSTDHRVQAVFYRVENGANVFGDVSAPVLAKTLAPNLPPATPQGLTIASATPDKIIVVAKLSQCRDMTVSQKKITATEITRTMSCVR